LTTSAPNQDLPPGIRRSDPRTVRAWAVYRESLRGLTGAEYEAAEARAWERLQRMLAEIERGRARLQA
jgi:hypothetical protein